MAARLTDKQKQKIIADYVQSGSYNAVGKANNVAPNTVKKLVQENADIAKLCEQKKLENTVDILEYMDSKRKVVCEIIETGLRVLPDKIENARTASEVTTALGTLIDKFTMARNLAEKTEDSGVIMMPDIGGDEAAKP